MCSKASLGGCVAEQESDPSYPESHTPLPSLRPLIIQLYPFTGYIKVIKVLHEIITGLWLGWGRRGHSLRWLYSFFGVRFS